MQSFCFAAFDGPPNRQRCDAQVGRGLSEIHPAFSLLALRIEDVDSVVAASMELALEVARRRSTYSASA